MTAGAGLGHPDRVRRALASRSGQVSLALVGLAGLLRIAGARNDLWLDEIWSLEIVRLAGSLAGIFTIHHDNNHLLNTIWLLAVGRDADEFWVRLPAVIAGTASVALAGVFVGRRSRAGGVIALVLTGASYLLVLYGSEARGYGLAVCFTLLSLVALDRQLERPAAPWALLFQAAVLLALVSHLTAVPAYAAIAGWGLLRCWRESRSFDRLLEHLVTCHAGPVVAVCGLYLFFAQDMVLGGGPDREPGAILRDTLALAVGVHAGPSANLAGAAVAVLAVAGALGVVWRRGCDRWVLYALGLGATPALSILLQRSAFLAPRYFLLPIVFFLLLASQALGELWRRPRARPAVALALAAFCAANAWPTSQLLAHGRGGYRSALRFMAESGGASPIDVAGDHDLRIGLVVEYYASRLPGSPRIVYRRADSLPPQGAHWLVTHRTPLDRQGPPPDVLNDRLGNRYRLERTWPSGPVAGMRWLLYRNEHLRVPGPHG